MFAQFPEEGEGRLLDVRDLSSERGEKGGDASHERRPRAEAAGLGEVLDRLHAQVLGIASGREGASWLSLRSRVDKVRRLARDKNAEITHQRVAHHDD